ncbi:beta-1,6-N-acetylglucosaminyltransferase [Brachyspira pilosicoli]|uniref:beta-1,6-N-acetylglucosaminyltransferase n=1 Tax=Brachyspira pilosicoli TaxID=52584 RepID=UPI002543B544|nr:beta-1,6-N-acetylglucosaminyltransferase [Brachyspira pilosicoli]WIH81398.1 beta-1,6-N-acetylglucosaminyltransferase [Brachyspira pilosicoli]WIH88098.1 beta-1,6-N-acetylglucosaminyltransferase [Brachyspira pilosicoli]
MKKNCILILAHKNHNQIMRLINHLKTDFDLYVHIDKRNKLNIKSFDNVNVYKEFKTYHGGVSLVIATLFLIEEAYKNNYDRYIFISGQDVPLKTNKEIINFFDTNKNKEYISYESINNSEAMYKEMSFRLNSYNFGKLYRLIFHRNIRELLSNFPLIKRITPKNIYYGSQWWNLTNNAIKYILDYTKQNPNFLKRFNYTWGSDEFYFQSILLNSEFKNNCINDNLRYLIWGVGTPINFQMKDYENIKNNINNNIFARKFDEDIDNTIIDKLYEDLNE